MTAKKNSCRHCVLPLEAQTSWHCINCDKKWHFEDGIWRTSSMQSPSGFDQMAVERLQDLEDGDHFWMRGRLNLFAKILSRISIKGDSALELGCGSGMALSLLKSRHQRVVGIDAYLPLLKRAAIACPHAQLIEADVCSPPLASSSFNLITAFDVIEHVDADAVLQEARRLISPNGCLLLSVPAFPILWSSLDINAGHRCRYRVNQLRNELKRQGWILSGYTHYQCLLFPWIFMSRRLVHSLTQSVERKPHPLLARILGMINHLEIKTLGNFKLPFGSSLIAWARPN